MANHAYLPRNGVATIPQLIAASLTVFGMGIELGTIVAVYSALLDGDGVSVSIGGPPSTTIPIIGPLLRPGGLTSSHNHFETDVSPTRGDLYQYGNNHDVRLEQLSVLYEMQAGVPDHLVNYDIPVLTEFHATRFNESLSQNPYFFNGPLSGVLIGGVVYPFIFRFFANKSEEYPEGRLDRETLKSFYAVTGSEPEQFVYSPGHERIPDNWYKRAIGDEHGATLALPDLIIQASHYPEFLDIGGNTGQVNTFTGVDLSDLTRGAFSAQTLLEGNNLTCFLLQVAQIAIPSGLLSGKPGASSLLRAALDGVLDRLGGCPKLESINEGLLDNFPGYRQLKADGSY